ncbi:MAG TPA: class I SAM-dependent methyltransferase [Polyangia bacterium]|jgi:hypothetical protein|nr:class I SAM-dependent methyltransferase [Polyangia bacterium]
MNENVAKRLLDETNDFDGARPVVEVVGMSSPKVCNFLNRLVAAMPADERYLEVGTWQGLTLLSAAYQNIDKVCIACDKFRFWGRWTGLGWRARRSFMSNLRRYRDRCAYIDFHHTTCERLFAEEMVQAPIGVYFFDGDHSQTGTRVGIAAAGAVLSERAVVLVDDWNIPEVQAGAREGLADAGLQILWRRALPGDHSKSGWWNGLGVFFVEGGRGARALARAS